MTYTLVFRRYAPFATFGGGFEGDCRAGPSTCLTDTARTIGLVDFSPGKVGNMKASTSGTAFHLFGTTVGNWIGKYNSDITAAVTPSTTTVDRVRFTAHTAGANPMIPFAPDIDTFVDIDAVFREKSLDITGAVRGDNFPNAEVFILDARGKAVLLFDFTTDGGRNTGPLTRLMGDHAAQCLGTFTTVIPREKNGAFH